MNVIDFHVHVSKPDAYMAEANAFVDKLNPAYRQRYEGGFPRPEEFVRELAAQGIDQAVILAEHAAGVTGHLATEWVVEYCREHPELIPAACINPNQDTDPRRTFEAYVTDLGARVLKLMPSYQFFYPNEARMYPIYQIAEDLGIPVMFHVGSSAFSGTRLKYCDPILLDDVARDFPKLPLIMCHAGRGFWYDQCAFMAAHYSNIFLDLAGLPPKRLLDYLPTLPRIANKVVFGSDWPAIPRTVEENVAAIRELPMPDDAKEAILHGTAETLLSRIKTI